LARQPWTEPDLDQLDVWEVRLQVGSLPSDDTEVSWESVAQAWLYGMDPDRNLLVGERPFDVADAHSAEAAYYFEHVFDPAGGFLGDVDEQFEWVVGRALFLHDVQVPPALRRRGHASLLVADAILTLAPTGTAVFAHPGPTDLDPGRDEVAWLRHETANTRFLARLGFVPFRDRMWTLDLSAGPGLETLASIRRR
jgi:GNAT superfamily N-acetyltransferase